MSNLEREIEAKYVIVQEIKQLRQKIAELESRLEGKPGRPGRPKGSKTKPKGKMSLSEAELRAQATCPHCSTEDKPVLLKDCKCGEGIQLPVKVGDEATA